MSEKVRDIESTVYLWFAANDTSGSAGDGASAAADVRLGGAAADAAPVLSVTPTLLSHTDYPAGCYEVEIAATTANGFAAGNDYAVFCTLAIDSQNPAGLVGEFRLEAANEAPNTVARIQDGLAQTGADGDTLETLSDQLDNVASAGDGARTIIFTLTDGAGTVANGLKTQVEDGSGNLVAGPLPTDSLGQRTYYLDDGSYKLVTPSTAVWQGNSEEVTVSASASVDVTLTAQTLPTPSAADKYVIILNAADEYGDLVGADAWTVKVTDVRPRGLSTANLVQLTERNAITVDGNGQASFEVSQETETVTLAITPTLADGTTGATETITVEIDADKADDEGRIYLADLMTD